MSGYEYEYEAVEINDYDLKRPRRRITKDEQIYGMWTDSDSDSEVEMTFRGVKRKTSGIGGIQHSGGFKVEEKDKDDNNQITDEEDHRPAHRCDDGNTSSNTSSDEAAKPQRMRLRMQPQQSSSISNPMGAWEQHTKGIGAKLLLQMRYKPGKGLGKDLQGIAQPVQAHLRKGLGAIGEYGPETPGIVGDKVTHKQNEYKDIPEAEGFNGKLNKWKRDDSKKESSKKNRFFRSVEEVTEKGNKSTGIDEDLYHIQAAKKPTGFALPELMHNFKQDIIAQEKQEALDHKGRNPEKIVRLENDSIQFKFY